MCSGPCLLLSLQVLRPYMHIPHLGSLPLHYIPAAVSYLESQYKPHCLLMSSLHLENAPFLYLAFAPFPQSPWPEMPYYPSGLS